jgi:hypothetical protein
MTTLVDQISFLENVLNTYVMLVTSSPSHVAAIYYERCLQVERQIKILKEQTRRLRLVS